MQLILDGTPSAHMNSYNEQFSKTRILRENNFYSMSDNLFNLSDRNVGNCSQTW